MAEFGSLQDDRSVSFVLISTDWPPEGARWSKDFRETGPWAFLPTGFAHFGLEKGR